MMILDLDDDIRKFSAYKSVDSHAHLVFIVSGLYHTDAKLH